MVRDWGLPSTDVIVVDNASESGQRQQLKLLESTIGTVLYNDVNRGYAGGNNRGIQFACSHNYDAVLLLNNDASIDAQSVKLLQETLAGHADAGMAGPLIYDGQFTNLQNAGGLDIAVHDITHRKVPEHESQPYVVDYVSGTVLLARTVMFERYGLLDEDYFFSGEIADFCRRCKEACMVHPGAKASHDTSQSGHLRSTLYTYYTVRNRYLYIRKNLYTPRWEFYPRWWRVHTRHAWSALKSGRCAEAGMVIRGVFDGMRSRTGAIS